jgi:hypothetical protein
VSTILGRFVIPIYYVLGERVIDFFARRRDDEDEDLLHPTPAHHGPSHAQHGLTTNGNTLAPSSPEAEILGAEPA